MKIKTKIDMIDINNNNFIITANNVKYYSIIEKGSVNFKIYNEAGMEMHLGNLEEGTIVTLYSKKNMIKKIKIKDNYIFLESSDDENELDTIIGE